MKRIMVGMVVIAGLLGVAVHAQSPPAAPWPRVKSLADGTRITAYQPQVDDWSFYVRLNFRMAMEILEPGAAHPVPAAVRLTAETNTDLSTRSVVLYNVKIVRANFPSTDDATAQRLTELLTRVLPTGPMKLSVDEILASVAPKGSGTASAPGPSAEAAAAPVGAAPPAAAPPRPAPAPRPIAAPPDPPVILYSQTPAVLVIFDGEPKFAPVEGTGLRFAVNTNWDMFQEEGKPDTFLLNGDSWLQAPGPTGPWAPVEKLPKSIYSLPKNDSWAEVHKNLPGKTIAKNQMPRVFVSVKPAELILLDGAPKLKDIKGTQLAYVANSDSDLFLFKADRRYYYLVSGRWFRAMSLDGPWTFASDQLPADFAKIPKDHPKAAVRASVPGTPEAQEAVMLAQAPHKAEVKRSDLTVEVKYTGDPQFVAVEGTTVYYAVNTANDVFQVDKRYYCCYQAVWFIAPSPTGPWTVADTIPAVIYTIPPSCPKYNVTYVTIYETSPTTVTVGYTSGYLGVYIVGACVVYGTGYYYPPYFYYPPHVWYPIYYPRPYSYGVAAFYNPYTGTFGRAAVAYGPYGGCGYAAAYNPNTGAYARGAAVWGPYAGRGYAEAYNPSTGAWAQKAGFYGPGGQAGYAARGYNPSTGTGAATYQRSNPYAQWGESVITKGDDWVHTGHYSDSRGTIAGYETSDGGKGGRVVTDRGSTTIATDADNNKYAAHDGNVYKNDGDSWQKYEDGSWQTVEKPVATDEQKAQAQSKAQSGQQQAQQKKADAQSSGSRTTASGTTRTTTTSASSQNYSQLEQERRARTDSSQRQKNYNSWKTNSQTSRSGASGSKGGNRRK
ncbi:MAG TPA: hypothetical protein PK176_09505 [Acidobacteriota bacterium]|nr:hypothetical protein [Acidobacteriota bacterium]HQM63534.1 hypothetical protein [Acidobacteriota bacterium]